MKPKPISPAPHPAVRKGPVIPRGWRKLHAGNIRRAGDRYGPTLYGKWRPCIAIGKAITRSDINHYGPYIRRLTRQQKGRKK